MKVLVFGGRNYNDWTRVKEVLDQVHSQGPITCIINGDSDGADWLSTRWAKINGFKDEQIKRYPAKWRISGVKNDMAGFERNQEMIDDNPDIDLSIEFPGGNGTADMRKRLSLYRIKILKIT